MKSYRHRCKGKLARDVFAFHHFLSLVFKLFNILPMKNGNIKSLPDEDRSIIGYHNFYTHFGTLHYYFGTLASSSFTSAYQGLTTIGNSAPRAQE